MKNRVKGLLLLSCLASIQTALGTVLLGTVTNNTNNNVVFVAAGEPLGIRAGETKNFNKPMPAVDTQVPDNIQLQRSHLVIAVPAHPEIEQLALNFVRNATLDPQLGTATLNNIASLQRGPQPIGNMWFGPAQPHNILRQGQEDDYRIDVVLEGDHLQNSQLEVTTSIIG